MTRFSTWPLRFLMENECGRNESVDDDDDDNDGDEVAVAGAAVEDDNLLDDRAPAEGEGEGSLATAVARLDGGGGGAGSAGGRATTGDKVTLVMAESSATAPCTVPALSYACSSSSFLRFGKRMPSVMMAEALAS